MKSNFGTEPFEKRAFRKNQEDLLAFCHCHNSEAYSLHSRHILGYSSVLYLCTWWEQLDWPTDVLMFWNCL